MRIKDTLEYMHKIKVVCGRPGYKKYLGHFMADTLRVNDSHATVSINGEERPVTPDMLGEIFSNNLATSMKVAEAYFVDKDMIPLLQWAAQSLDEDATFERETFPTPFGFVLLEDALISQDARGRETVTKAFAWGYQGDGMMSMYYFTDVEDDRDEVTLDLMTTPGPGGRAPLTRNEILEWGRLQVNHMDMIKYGAKVGPMLVDTSSLPPDAYGLPGIDHAENTRRFLLAFLLMLDQTIVAPERHETSGKQAARFMKKQVPHAVTVIRMRRISGANRAEGETHVEWARRWIVRGHWRKQPYKVDGEIVHRRIWIAPYVKNAHRTDLPLVVPQKVYALVR